MDASTVTAVAPTGQGAVAAVAVRSSGLSWWQRLLLIMIVGVLMAMSMLGQASAKPDGGDGSGDGSDGVSSSQVCATTDGDYSYLPVQRWNGATSTLIVRDNGGVGGTVQGWTRDMQGFFFWISDFIFYATSELTDWSINACPMKTVGGLADQAAGTFGKKIVNSPLLVGIVIITVVAMIGQTISSGARGNQNWIGRLLAKLLVVALVTIMVAGAANSTGGGIDGKFDQEYKPGHGSPGWWATSIDTAVTQLAAAPAAAIATEPILDGSAGKSSDQMDCSAYLAAMQRAYVSGVSDSGGVIKSTAVPSLTVSNLWQISAYNAWSASQFGNRNLNGNQRVACRLLDRNADIPVGIQSFLLDGQTDGTERSAGTVTNVFSNVPAKPMSLTETAKYIHPNAPAFRPLNDVELDKAAIAWAACIPKGNQIKNLSSKDGWHTPTGNSWLIHDDNARKNADKPDGSPKLQNACYSFFNEDTDKVDGIFDWKNGSGELDKHKDQMPASVYNFISSLHGSNFTAGGGAGIAYFLTALGTGAVFGGLAVSILITKVLMVIMLFGIMIVMMSTLLPSGGAERFVKYTKQYVGLSLFAAFSICVMSVIIFVTKIIWLVLERMTGGPNNIMTMLIGGLAPVGAAVGLHFAFVRAGLPSPVTPKGAMSWSSVLTGEVAMQGIVTGAERIGGLARRGASKLNPARRRRERKAEQARQAGKYGPPNRNNRTTQKPDPRRPKGSGPAPTGRPQQDPRDVLKDPNASAAQKRRAQRQLDRDRDKAGRTGTPGGGAGAGAGGGVGGKKARMPKTPIGAARAGASKLRNGWRNLSPESKRKVVRIAGRVAVGFAEGGPPGAAVAAGIEAHGLVARGHYPKRAYTRQDHQTFQRYRTVRNNQAMEPRRSAPGPSGAPGRDGVSGGTGRAGSPGRNGSAGRNGSPGSRGGNVSGTDRPSRSGGSGSAGSGSGRDGGSTRPPSPGRPDRSSQRMDPRRPTDRPSWNTRNRDNNPPKD